jgi:hypothetical protein
MHLYKTDTLYAEGRQSWCFVFVICMGDGSELIDEEAQKIKIKVLVYRISTQLNQHLPAIFIIVF